MVISINGSITYSTVIVNPNPYTELLCSLQGSVANVNEKVTWNRVSVPDVIAMRIGTEDQVYNADYILISNQWRVSLLNKLGGF